MTDRRGGGEALGVGGGGEAGEEAISQVGHERGRLGRRRVDFDRLVGQQRGGGEGRRRQFPQLGQLRSQLQQVFLAQVRLHGHRGVGVFLDHFIVELESL